MSTRTVSVVLALALLFSLVGVMVPPLANPAEAQTVTLISDNTGLNNMFGITTDGTYLYISGNDGSSVPTISRIPITGGSGTPLYQYGNGPMGIAVIGDYIFWIDPNAGPYTDTQILKAPKDGSGSVTAILTSSAAGNKLEDGSGLTADGVKLYGADEIQGRTYSLNPDGSGITQLGGSRYSGWFDTEHLNTVAESEGVLYIADSGKTGVIQPLVTTIPSTGGSSFTSLWEGAPFVQPGGIAVGAGMVYASDASAGNTIWKLPTTGDTPTALVSGDPFVSITGLTFFDDALYVLDSGAGKVYKVNLTDNQPPTQPAGTSPSDGATGVNLTPTLQSSAFSDPDTGDTHTASQWQVSTTSDDYSSPVFDSGTDTSNLTSVTISSGTLSYDTTYYWHVRHQDNNGAWSDWSVETSFTTFNGVVDFPDSNLEAVIREAIGKPTGDIYDSDLAGITNLDPVQKGITDITGLEYCTGLEALSICFNAISDVSPLSTLTGLHWLDLEDNQVSDVSPLSNLAALTGLFLANNLISDISPLSNLTGLDTLFLGYNLIDDISLLSNLTKLNGIDLAGNLISDISSLSNLAKLNEIWLSDNQISDIEPLVNNIGLSNGDIVHLGNNPLSELSLNDYVPQLEARGVEVVLSEPPEADFLADNGSGSAPLMVYFTDESAGDITAWEWDFDSDGTVDSTEQNPIYEYEYPGRYTVSLKVTGPGGEDIEIKDEYITVEERSEEDDESSGFLNCSCNKSESSISSTELLTGWGIIGLCWGSGYYLVRKRSKRHRK